MTNEEKDDFIKWVKSLTKYEFYKECVECRQISFGTVDDDDMGYFYMLVNAYAASEKQKLIDNACEWLESEATKHIGFNMITEEPSLALNFTALFRKAMEETKSL